MTGEEVKKILVSNGINLSVLAEKIGISPQSLANRLKAETFKTGYLMEMTQVIGRDIFGVDPRQPIIDIRACSGAELAGEGCRVEEYVSVPAFSGCIGIMVYGDGMRPEYRAGDIIFVRELTDRTDIDYGRTYLIVTPEDRLLKNVYQSGHAGYLCLSSANTERDAEGRRLFPDRELRTDAVLHLYKVVGSLRRERI